MAEEEEEEVSFVETRRVVEVVDRADDWEDIDDEGSSLDSLSVDSDAPVEVSALASLGSKLSAATRKSNAAEAERGAPTPPPLVSFSSLATITAASPAGFYEAAAKAKSQPSGLGDTAALQGQVKSLRALMFSKKLTRSVKDRQRQKTFLASCSTARWLAKRRKPVKWKTLDSAQVQLLNAFFRAIDLNGSGRIDREEFANAMRLLGVQDRREVDKMFDSIDVDGSGDIDFSEFCAKMTDRDDSAKKAKDAQELIEKPVISFALFAIQYRRRVLMEAIINKNHSRVKFLANAADGPKPRGVSKVERGASSRNLFPPLASGSKSGGGGGGGGGTGKPTPSPRSVLKPRPPPAAKPPAAAERPRPGFKNRLVLERKMSARASQGIRLKAMRALTE